MSQIVHTDQAPAAIGPYSQAVQAGSTVYLSGQIGLDPASMQMAEGIDAQIVRVFDNLKAVCEAAGGTMGAHRRGQPVKRSCIQPDTGFIEQP